MVKVSLIVLLTLIFVPFTVASGFLFEMKAFAHNSQNFTIHPAVKKALDADNSIYFGDLHNHTGYSPDGRGTPKQAYASGKHNGLDFMAITEHSEGLYAPFSFRGLEYNDPQTILNLLDQYYSPLPRSTEWQDISHQAKEITTDDEFVAIRGFEWSDPYQGHFNVWFSETFTDVFRSPGIPTMAPFWDWFQRDPVLGGSDGIGGFNHPGREMGKFNNFSYVPGANERVVSLEVFNRDDIYEKQYIEALDKGWHVGAIGVSDHHGEDWGDRTFPRTGIIVPKLTTENVKKALEDRHVYATQDWNFQLAVQGNGQLTGARLETNKPVQLDITGWDPDDTDSVVSIEVITNNGKVIKKKNNLTESNQFVSRTFDVPVLQGSENWFFVKLVQADGEKIYSSPIWVQTLH